MRRVALWVAFAAAHVWAITLGWLWPNQPMGDTYLVYEPWAVSALSGGEVMGVDASWVYPPLALAPMILAKTLVWFSSYSLAWAVLVAVCDALAFAVLLGRGSSRPRRLAAGYWTVFLALLGPIAIFRIDAISVPLALVGLVLAARRPAIAGALIGAATWIKVWPAAIVAALVIALRRRVRVVWGGLAVSLAIAGVIVAAGGSANLLSFIAEQGGRGLQIEAVAATPFLFGFGGAAVEYSHEILTFQVVGAGTDAISAALTPVMAFVVLLICLLGAWRVRAGAPIVRVLPPLALALVAALIVTNKVGSPQFQSWLVVPILLWIVWDRRRAVGPAALVLVIAMLTHIVYPIVYQRVLETQTPALLVLAARNFAVVGLLVWAVAALWSARAQERSSTLVG
ncbi:hypothetical protein GCM10010910_12740 [Microbacterium nanhaiense]|uniref:DUF2029 domain-containing protein n=1 Tax=Microbacterium nanhaiense TaxID=1301026 RepID=A0ABQ2MZQ8_9MICO|nr:glycosyltransferase 87 family protein [Microbacterium nanhaiense]GGO62499.1 hypothetical protein GCM10010910_12740 [Microbacterium nanhaiense]